MDCVERGCISLVPRSFIEMGNYSQFKKGAERNANHYAGIHYEGGGRRRVSLGIFGGVFEFTHQQSNYPLPLPPPPPPLVTGLRRLSFFIVCSYDLMLTCYLVSDCGHSICGSCQKRQVDQSATRCPVCNVTLNCYIPNIALRNAARELACTCKHCKRQITAEAIESHKKECGEIPVQCNTCPEKFPRNQLRFHDWIRCSTNVLTY